MPIIINYILNILILGWTERLRTIEPLKSLELLFFK